MGKQNRFHKYIDECFPPKAQFSVDEIPDLSGKVIIVTGGNSGIGRETVKVLLLKKAKVYIATRNEEKSLAVIEELYQETGERALFLQLDLSDLASVRSAAEAYKAKENKIDVLFNNAGVFSVPLDQLTKQGYDSQTGTNLLGPFYFTHLLLPILLASPGARVINTGSITHLTAPKPDVATFIPGPKRDRLSTAALYGQSKWAMICFNAEFARRYGSAGLVSIAINPGNIRSGMQRHMSRVQQAMANAILYPPELGCLTQLYAGTMPEGAKLNGAYMVPWARVGAPREGATDPELCKSIWDWLEEAVAKFEKEEVPE
ncbi:NAD-P-binding protein [Cylindrobasidium torrendii FP15055 ss-10]|uniref:NAD-P-binding protein n=1 Tax=Cylindrobasidium torrendii FP15055 ss-10 TaxID=1314674 RepID=A0A0D7BL28_9AGAR|nr:NAD-P-binding protein [Cylindrobasidium torrendii FP15055 ss-10]